MDSRGVNGIGQGYKGVQQGPAGALAGATGGAQEGISRAASGGMEGKTPADAQRKSMGLFDFLSPIASLASSIPGPWQPFAMGASALLGGLSGSKAQGQAAGAAGAAQGAQGNALQGASNIAGKLAGTPDYSGILNAERSGIETLRANQGGIANQGAVMKDLAGNNTTNAISGALAGNAGRQEAAAGILQGNAGQYNQIGQQAGSAAQSFGNPFQSLLNTVQGGGGKGLGDISSRIGGIFNPGGQTGMDISPSTGGIDIGPGSSVFGTPTFTPQNTNFGTPQLPTASDFPTSVTMGNQRRPGA
jgi:hypothetical protein